LDEACAPRHQGESFAFHGVVALEGGGCTDAPLVAQELKRWGYDVALLADSDRPLKPDARAVSAMGVNVIQWGGQTSTEERLVADLPWSTVQTFIDKAISLKGEAAVLDQVAQHLGGSLHGMGNDINAWASGKWDQAAVRTAIGQAAKAGEWFKDLNSGQELGEIAVAALPHMTGTDFAEKISLLERWIYA
jgi:hypothetical protein